MTKLAITCIAFLIGSWLVFDGTRALVTGQYTTAKSGPHAGQLGPWAKLVSSLGLDQRSALIKWLHVGLGLAWLVSPIVFSFHPALGWRALLLCSVFTLGYLPVGTVLSLIELSLLLLPSIRNLR